MMELGQMLMQAADASPRHHPKGDAHHNAKLTEDAVREIRQMPRLSRQMLAKKYGVGQTTIHAVRVGATWPHVK